MNGDEEQVYLEVFVWHLAAHLCGAQAILGDGKERGSKKNFRLYWRSAPLLLDAPSSTKNNGEDAAADPSTNGTTAGEEAERCAFIDATFEFAHDSAKSTAETKSEPRIQMRWGSLWLSSREEGARARYFTGNPVTYQDLDAHFGDAGPLNADPKSNEASVLARQMAHALQSLAPIKARCGGTSKETPSCCPGGIIHLDYGTLSTKPAPLRVANTEGADDDDSQQRSSVGKGLLEMLLLQHSSLSSSSAPTPTEATKEDLDKISKFIEQEWKPAVGADSPQKPQAAPPAKPQSVAAAAANPPPKKKQSDANGSTEKKRKLAPAPKKPVVFRAKPPVTRVGGTKKKKKKNLYG